jgi:hypothetical protein
MAEPFGSVEPLMSMMTVVPELVKTAEPVTAVKFAVRFQDPDPDTVTALAIAVKLMVPEIEVETP